MPRRDLIQYRRGTAAQWASVNPILAAGEVGFAVDSNQVRVGDGVTNWLGLDPIGDTIPEEQIEQAVADYLAQNPLTAVDVGARPDDWVPTVGEIDAAGVPSALTYLRGDGTWSTPPGGGGGGGAVDSVNGQTGVVVLDQDDIADGVTARQFTAVEQNKLAGVEPGAEVNVQSDWNASSGDAAILNKPALGTAAAADASDFATAAQGGRADSAVQPGALAAVATSGDYSDLNGRPTLGTAASQDSSVFATAAQGGLADTAVQPGDLAAVATSGEYADLDNLPTIPSTAADVGARSDTWEPTVADIDATGTPSAVTYLRGDGTWSTPPSGGGGGAVDSVNGQVGTVNLDQDDIPDGNTYKRFSSAEQSKLSGVEAGAQVNAVSSVNGATGVVVLAAGDVGAATAAQGGLANTAVQPGDLAAVATTGAYLDLSGVPTLGTAAAADASDFATAGQGALADTATQPGDLATVATTGDYGDLSGRPTLGTAAAQNSTAFATAQQGSTADSAVQPGDLATVATSGDYDDLLGKPTLGSAAAASTGDFATAGQGALADTAVQPAALAGYVPTSRTVAGKALTGDVSLVKGDVGLGNVDNTADSAKPVSTAQQAAINAAKLVPLNAQTANYTLVLADGGKAVEMSNAAARTVTVPPNSSVAFPVGTVIEVARMGTGTVTVVAGSGVTIRTAGTLALRAQYSVLTLRKRATDEWVLAGDTD